MMKKQESFSRRCRKPLWLMLPALLGFAIFYLVPFGLSVYYSLLDNMFSRTFAGLANYLYVLDDPYYRLALANTVIFTVVSVPLGVVLGFTAAAILKSTQNKLNRMRGILLLPMLLPSAAVVTAIGALFGETGVLWQLLEHSKINYRISLYVFYLWKNTGLFMLLFMAGFAGIDSQLYEAAALDGCSRFRQHIWITLPLSLPTVFFVVILAAVNSMKVFKEAYLLYGGYPDRSVYMVQHYMNHQFETLHYQNLTSAAIVFAAAIYLVTAVGMLVVRRIKRRNQS